MLLDFLKYPIFHQIPHCAELLSPISCELVGLWFVAAAVAFIFRLWTKLKSLQQKIKTMASLQTLCQDFKFICHCLFAAGNGWLAGWLAGWMQSQSDVGWLWPMLICFRFQLISIFHMSYNWQPSCMDRWMVGCLADWLVGWLTAWTNPHPHFKARDFKALLVFYRFLKIFARFL